MNIEETIAKKLDILVTAVRLETSGAISNFVFVEIYKDTLNTVAKMASSSSSETEVVDTPDDSCEWSNFSAAKESFIAP